MEIRKELVPEIMQDLMVLYLADEASPATRAVVETYAQQNKDFAALLRSSGATPPEAPRGRDSATQVLTRTRKYLKLKKVLFGVGLFLCLVPFTVEVRHSKIVFFMWRDAPAMAMASLTIGIAAWAWYWARGRQVGKAGL